MGDVTTAAIAEYKLAFNRTAADDKTDYFYCFPRRRRELTKIQLVSDVAIVLSQVPVELACFKLHIGRMKHEISIDLGVE